MAISWRSTAQRCAAMAQCPRCSGHKRGAFTGAQNDRAGLLRTADSGLLFLDEIGELGLDEQAMILRAIEEKRFLPVGSDQESTSNFQLIAGTNRNLRYEVHHGRFRADLLARLDLWTFELLGLTDRTEDIEGNVEYEIARFAATNGASVDVQRRIEVPILVIRNQQHRPLTRQLSRLKRLHYQDGNARRRQQN